MPQILKCLDLTLAIAQSVKSKKQLSYLPQTEAPESELLEVSKITILTCLTIFVCLTMALMGAWYGYTLK